MMASPNESCDKKKLVIKGHHGKGHPRWHRVLGSGFFLLCALGIFTVVWFAMQALFGVLGEPPALPAYILTILFGFVVTALCGFAYKRIAFRRAKKERSNHWQIGQEVLEAIDRISQGDYNVHITSSEHEPFAELATSVNNMAAELGTLEQQRQEFISNVSHELQSPLTSIQGFASLLLSTPVTEEENQRYLSIIETEAIRLSRLSDNLLRLTALDSDEAQLNSLEFSLDGQLRSAILMLEPQWSGKNLDFDLQLESVSYSGDEDLLNQVWINLLQNAVKYSPENSAIRIVLSIDEDTGNYNVVIADAGVGIEAQDLPHIFERFYRADKARDRSEGGNGLGLPLVKRIIELHKGSITVSSEVSRGTTFSVVLSSQQQN